jgi:hypothetical protein
MAGCWLKLRSLFKRTLSRARRRVEYTMAGAREGIVASLAPAGVRLRL